MFFDHRASNGVGSEPALEISPAAPGLKAGKVGNFDDVEARRVVIAMAATNGNKDRGYLTYLIIPNPSLAFACRIVVDHPGRNCLSARLISNPHVGRGKMTS